MHDRQGLSKPFFLALFFSLFCMQTEAYAGVYKCEAGGKILLSQIPCAPDQRQLSYQEMHPDISEKTRQDAIAQAAKEKSSAEKLRQQRVKAEQKSDAELRRQITKNEKQKQQCDKAKLHVTWAKQDLDHAKPQVAAKARQKFERSKQSAELICKANSQ